MYPGGRVVNCAVDLVRMNRVRAAQLVGEEFLGFLALEDHRGRPRRDSVSRELAGGISLGGARD